MFGGYHPGANLRYAISATRTWRETTGFSSGHGGEIPTYPPYENLRPRTRTIRCGFWWLTVAMANRHGGATKKRSGYSAPRTRTIRLWFLVVGCPDADRLGGATKNGVGFPVHALGRKPRGLYGRPHRSFPLPPVSQT